MQRKGLSFEATDLNNAYKVLHSEVSDIINNIIDFSKFNTTTKNGITCTVDKSNCTCTLNGTATSNALFYITPGRFSGFSKLILSGGADGGGSTTYNLSVYEYPSGSRYEYIINSTVVENISLNENNEYTIAIVVFSGQTVNNLVFKPRGYVSGRLLEDEDKISEIENVMNNMNKIIRRWTWYAGAMYVCNCGNKLSVECISLRLHDGSRAYYTESMNTSVMLNNNAITVRYLNFDGENFSITSYMSSDSICMLKEHLVFPLIEGVVANYRKIQNGYIRTNSSYFLNFDRTPIKGCCQYFSPGVKLTSNAYQYTSAGTKYYTHTNLDDTTYSFKLLNNDSDISNKKILMIGDSFVARGYIQNYLKTFEPTLQFIGTRTTQNYNYKGEGVSGSRLYWFLDPETSPFIFNDELNFSNYLASNNLESPDYVIINSAINHSDYINTTYGTYQTQLTRIVNMIKSYSNDIKVYVTFGANYAMNVGSTYGYPISRFEEVRKCCNSTYAVENVTVIPVDYCLIDELDYNYTTLDYFGDSIKILSDCVHPKETTGFRKIAMMIYNYLGI